MTPLVRKLLRDVRWPLLVVMLLLGGFQCLWVKITQRTVVEIAPVFSTLAARAGTNKSAIENVIFSGPGKLAQTIIGGESLHFERASPRTAQALAWSWIEPSASGRKRACSRSFNRSRCGGSSEAT